MAKKDTYFETDYKTKYFLVGIQSPYNKTDNIASYYEEFLSLAKTYGVKEYEITYIKLRSLDPKHFFTKGKLQELKQAFDEYGGEELVLSDQISPQQERNLHDLFHCPILDRTRLILAIFEKSAVTAEGKIQVDIAKLQFEKTRLAGKGVHLDQQGGSVGTMSGAGETLKEKNVRHINQSVHKLKEHLEQLNKARQARRQKRLVNKVPHVCLIGYTNAGKSTLLNLLTNSDVLAEDKLFATLDTTTRKLFVGDKKIGLLSDTVGFIQKLPHQLIDAFQSTLSELQYADLLLLVIDISDNNWQTQIDVVLHTIDELNIEKEMLFVFNKSDKLTTKELQQRLNAFGFFAPYVVINCQNKENLAPLKKFLLNWTPPHERSK